MTARRARVTDEVWDRETRRLARLASDRRLLNQHAAYRALAINVLVGALRPMTDVERYRALAGALHLLGCSDEFVEFLSATKEPA